jgi:hypothetical protein
VRTTLPDGRLLNNLYYGSGHLHQVNLDGEVVTDIERDRAHRMIARTQGALISQFRYDPRGALFESVISHPGGYYARLSDSEGNQFEIECESFDEVNRDLDPSGWSFYKRY